MIIQANSFSFLYLYKLVLSVSILLITATPALTAEAGRGSVYSVVELVFNGPTLGPSDTPAKDVDFWVRVQHESGSPSYKIHGFWDGDGQGGNRGNVFKVRFCPTRAGRWNIAEVSSNRQELVQKQGDYITATASNLHGFWEVDTSSPGNRWYKRSDGSHQYIVGNTIYSFISEMYTNGPNGSDIAKDIKGNAGYFKKVRFSPIGDRYPHPSERPFLTSSGSPTNNGADSHRPNPQWFYKRVDLAVKTAFDLDLIADLIMAAVDVDELRYSISPANNGRDPGPFFKYLIARYGAYPNVWFCLINEGDHGNKTPHFSYGALRDFGVKAKSYMAYPSPLSVHLRANWDSGMNSNPSWNDHVIFQQKLKNISSSADAIRRNYSSGGSNKPVVNDELSYQGSGDGHSEADTIESHLGAFLGGGYGTTGYKSGNKLGQYFAGNFNASQHSSADNLLYMREVIDKNISFWRMAPDSSGVLSGGVRTLGWEGNEYVAGTNGGGTVTANLPSGGTWTVKVYDIFAKSEKVISTSATGKVSIAAPGSRAGIVHVRKNGIAPNPNPNPTPQPNELQISLREGWNLVSFPVAESTAVSTILSGIQGKFDALYAYDSSAQTYRTYIPGESGNDLTSVSYGRGYWLYMSEDATLSVPTTGAGRSVSLTSGWNLVGYNGTGPQSTTNALKSIEGKYVAVYGFNGESYRSHLPGEGGDLTQLRPGEGYWIYMDSGATWQP
jgi:hypothetical protein